VREADHSPPSSAEVKECVELYLHSPIRLPGVVLSLKIAQGQTYLYKSVQMVKNKIRFSVQRNVTYNDR
jgi:hypothetical protein